MTRGKTLDARTSRLAAGLVLTQCTIRWTAQTMTTAGLRLTNQTKDLSHSASSANGTRIRIFSPRALRFVEALTPSRAVPSMLMTRLCQSKSAHGARARKSYHSIPQPSVATLRLTATLQTSLVISHTGYSYLLSFRHWRREGWRGGEREGPFGPLVEGTGASCC